MFQVLPARIQPLDHDEKGMNTAEYAVGTGAACGFGGLLYSILTSDFGRNLIEGILDKVTDFLPF